MSRKQKDAAVAQSVVRRIGSAEVTGPIPVSSFVNCLWRLIQAGIWTASDYSWNRNSE